jgi:hypothetical protein
MEMCQFNKCESSATRTITAPRSEQNDQKDKEAAMHWNFEAKIYVCDNHLEQVKERLSHIS